MEGCGRLWKAVEGCGRRGRTWLVMVSMATMKRSAKTATPRKVHMSTQSISSVFSRLGSGPSTRRPSGHCSAPLREAVFERAPVSRL